MAVTTRRDFLWTGTATLAAGMCGTQDRGTRPDGAERTADSPPDPRLAICNETFGDWPRDKAFALAAECGYTGIEIAPFTLGSDLRAISPAIRGQVCQQVRKSGLEIVGLHWLLARTEGFHLTSPDRGTRQRTSAYLIDLARLCSDLGGRLLVFGSPKQRNLLPGTTREQGFEAAVAVIQAVLPVLERLDLTLAIEPLSSAATNFLTTAAEAAELIQRVDSPRCGLILDCLAMSSESTPLAELIQRHAERLVHFHANDPNGQGPGFGQLDFVPILAALRSVGYRGWVSVEVFDYSPGAERLARESIRYLRDCLVKSRSQESHPRPEKETRG